MPRTILVYDERFESGPRFVAAHKNVPDNWTARDIMERLGLSDHLCIYAEDDDKPPTRETIIHVGSRYEHE